jgi:NADH-quinone oxidoreductase subunit J
VFICASLVLIEMGAEFIAILLILVYIGAIAVLFLFVIMLLNIRLIELNLFYINYKSIVFFYSLFFLLQVIFLFFFKNIDHIFIDYNIINYF